MFRCTNCKVSSLPKIKPIIVPVEERTRQYNFYDAEGNPKVTFGTETVREAWLCPGCAGVEAHAEPVVDLKASVGLGLAMQGHARKCNKKLDECFVCQRAIKTMYPSIPAPAINKVLSETQVHNGRLSIAELVVTSMMRRTTEQVKNGRQGLRAKADFLAAFPVLKSFEQRGGKL